MIKKLLALIWLTALALPVAAQARYAHGRSSAENSNYRDTRDLYCSVRLGLAMSRCPSDEARLDGGRLQLGINAGAAVGLQVVTGVPVYVEAGLLYTQKGGRGNVAYAGGEGTGSRKVTYGLDYLEVPLVAKYFAHIGYESSFQPFIGGYIAYGVGGTVKDFGLQKETSSFSDSNFKRFDGGLRAGFAFQFSMVYLEAAYDLGLVNVGQNSFGSTKTGSVSVSVGVNF